MTFSTFLSTNHVRAYHVTLSCGLHGADDVVHAGEQKVKLFVLISDINLGPHSLAQRAHSCLLASGFLSEAIREISSCFNSHAESVILCSLDMTIRWHDHLIG